MVNLKEIGEQFAFVFNRIASERASHAKAPGVELLCTRSGAIVLGATIWFVDQSSRTFWRGLASARTKLRSIWLPLEAAYIFGKPLYSVD